MRSWRSIPPRTTPTTMRLVDLNSRRATLVAARFGTKPGTRVTPLRGKDSGTSAGLRYRRRRPPHRGGYVLVLFVLMFFALLGLAALVIDLGFARLTQRQMQSAADSAALEGLLARCATARKTVPDRMELRSELRERSGRERDRRSDPPLGGQPSRRRRTGRRRHGQRRSATEYVRRLL